LLKQPDKQMQRRLADRNPQVRKLDKPARSRYSGAMTSKLTIDEVAARGGRSKSPQKLAAARKNLVRAQAVRNEKRARSKERPTIA
jgi:hypothetical protein